MGEAILYVTDLERMTAFYEGCAGLAPVDSGTDHRGLGSPDWMLWLVIGEAPKPEVGSAPRRRSAVPVKLAFAVPSIDQARERAEELGGSLGGERWSFDGRDRCDGIDPEGNVIQFVEPTPIRT